MKKEKGIEYEIFSIDMESESVAASFASGLRKVADGIEGKKGVLRIHLTFEEIP